MVGWSRISHGLVLGLALTACETGANEPDAEPLEVLEISTDELQQICPTTRIIGRAKLANMGMPATCPARNNWTVSNLFESGTPFLDNHPPDFTPAMAAPTEMGMYCVYEWAGNTAAPTLAQLNALRDTLSQPAADCLAMQGLSAPMNEQIGPILQEIFRDLAGGVSASELQYLANDPDAGRSGVLVSVVDTVPYSQPVHMNWPHGEYLARMIEDLACPAAGACEVEVARVLAMPRVTATETDFQHGGIAGLLTDLARGLMEAHHRWELGDQTRKHIVTLSLGFDESSIDRPGLQLANIDSIHTALEFLSCNGAIVIAAAGNADQVGCTNDAVYPARWQRELAPSSARCSALGVFGVPEPGHRPLVFAAAGTQLDGELLASARTGGLPRLAAIADHAIGGDPEDDALTGSSVAAAVTGAAAAMAWSFADDLDGVEVMDAVYTGALPTAIGMANMVVPSTSAMVKQVNVCGALTQACATGSCPTFTTPCVADTVADPPLTDLDFAYDAEPVAVTATNAPVQCGAAYEICTADVWAGSVDLAADACVATERQPIERLVDPQPPQPGCPPCTFKAAEKTLYMSLSEDYANKTVTKVSVVFTDDQGVDHPVDLGVPLIDAYSTKPVQIDARNVPATIKNMTVTVEFDDVKPTNDVLLR